MKVLETPEEVRAFVGAWRRERLTVGFVPTLGALHEGHLSLARWAREECDRFVASIFVNPLQFDDPSDLERYDRPFEKDTALLREAGCDALFAPSVEVMYGDSATFVEVSGLGDGFEGELRPGHFRGVATVVAKLFGIVAPDRAYFGEKDYQQLKVVEKLAEDLYPGVEVVPCPTVREPDGLAMSSRNARLSPDERRAATALRRALLAGAALAEGGERDAGRVVSAMRGVLDEEPLVAARYVAVVDAESLEPLEVLGGTPARALVAADLGGTHLVDNAALPRGS